MRRLRDLEFHDWLLLPLVAVLFGGGLYLSGIAIDSYRAEHGGIAGQVTVEDCVLDNTEDGPSWECSGPFVSDDGAVRIASVTLDERFREPPADGSTLAGTVAGSSAETIYTDDKRWVWTAVFAVAFFGIGAFLLVPILRGDPDQDEVRQPVDPEVAAASARAKQFLEEWAHVFQASAPVAAAPALSPVVATRTRPNVVLWKVLAGWLLLGLTIVGVLWHLAEWNRDQDGLLSATTIGTVTADHLGAQDRIEVSFLDGGGGEWWVRLTPLDADRFLTGSHIPLRYDPAEPDQAVPADAASFEPGTRDRNVWTGLVLAPGIVLIWAWAWRLGRWALGAGRRATPATARVHVAVLVWTPPTGNADIEPTAFWLELESDGRTWYQRIIWDRRLVRWLDGVRWGADGTPISQVRLPLEVRLRRCPGLRRMYLVDAAGVGRLWPASTARGRPPRNYYLSPFEPGILGSAEPVGRHVRIIVALAVVAVVGWFLAGPSGSAYLLVLIGAFQLWGGGVPWRGFYAVQPKRDAFR